MVGAPKMLTDLRRIDAGVQVTCRTCGRARLLDREKLVADLLRRRRPLSWDTLPAQLRCACGSKDVRIRPLPFSDPVQPLVDRLVSAADRLVAALSTGGTDVPSLTEMAASRLEFQEAKRALLAWAELRG